MAAVETETSAQGPPGWYGKLASLGDFAQRRLPPHWVRHCDTWLAGLMRELPHELGPRWLDTYLTAPVLRFAWAPGVVDMRWWFGVLMPSCDNVGRYFPLLITQSRMHPPIDRQSLDHLERWYTVVARVALQTLGDGASVDGFEQALAGAPAWPLAGMPPPAPIAEGPWLQFTASSSSWRDAVPLLAAGELLERLAGCTLWSPALPAPAPANLRWGPGLPTVTGFAGLLKADGQT
ncbi:type VI secretion system-associated protein TagF [Ideonella azotifigens]|uniref:Type VI secretion system-associated protein TagF n=1 Tax=Ideonella azotifigens TaxID=513160 RepID=A0ABP3VGN2_9BURK|nr:type VI secretion system-associated protein TagF [Ideonella azotifigens]MCD2344341.1 type VI secretion system-associated protein TagF [Ideonella azotifigens]